MLRKNKEDKKSKSLPPTEEEFLNFFPIRGNYQWSLNSEGLVEIRVPKFQTKIGKSLCKMVRRDEDLIGKLDKLGSLVWQHCDGSKQVKDILKVVKKEFPDEENIDQRLFLFLQQIDQLNYIDLMKKQ